MTCAQAPSQFKNEQKKLPKMVYFIPNFLVLHFGENFMKTCFHSHFYANFYEFFWWAIKTACILQIYTADFLYGF